MADEVEQTFLAAIAANPHDREARAVYADWLDERGDPRGEYLRLELLQHELPARMAALAAALDEAWLAQVVRTCDLELVASGDRKISVIKSIREVTGLGLKDSKDIADRATPEYPEPIKRKVSIEEARALRTKFVADGALVRIIPHAGSARPRPVAPTYNPPSPDVAAVRVIAIPAGVKVAAMMVVRELTGCGLQEAKTLVDRVAVEPVTLSTGRERALEASRRLTALGCTVEVR